MFLKQLSVFIENREGRLEQVTKILADKDINIICISLADTKEYGMLRMIVSEPERGMQLLKENDFSARLTDVIAVKLPHHFGTLYRLTNVLAKGSINIEYMYALTTGSENASIIIKTADNERAVSLIEESELELFDPEMIYRL